MRYRVTFRQRFDANGEPAEDPRALLELGEDLIQDAELQERLEPPSVHVEDQMEEDDDFMAYGTVTWTFDVMDGREQEFMQLLAGSRLVRHVEALPDTPPVDLQ